MLVLLIKTNICKSQLFKYSLSVLPYRPYLLFCQRHFTFHAHEQNSLCVQSNGNETFFSVCGFQLLNLLRFDVKESFFELRQRWRNLVIRGLVTVCMLFMNKQAFVFPSSHYISSVFVPLFLEEWDLWVLPFDASRAGVTFSRPRFLSRVSQT